MSTGDYLVPSEALADNSRVFTQHQVFPRVVIAAACGAVSLNLPGITRCRQKKNSLVKWGMGFYVLSYLIPEVCSSNLPTKTSPSVANSMQS